MIKFGSCLVLGGLSIVATQVPGCPSPSSGTRHPRRVSNPPPRATRPPPSSPRYILRQGRLQDAALRRVVVVVDRPVVVETRHLLRAGYQARSLNLTLRLPLGGFVRAVRPGKHPYLGSSDYTTLGRYVLRRTKLWWQRGRVPIGVAYVGAFLPIYQDGKRWVRVALLGYRNNTTLANRRVKIDNRYGAPLAWVRASDLGVRIPNRLPPSDPWSTPARDHYRTLHLTPEGRAYSALSCGPVRVIARRGQWVRLAQLHQGVEIRGWTDHDIHAGRGDGPCSSRTEATGRVRFGRWSLRGAGPPVRPTPPPPNLVGRGGARLSDPSGQRIGHLPPGAIVLRRGGGQGVNRAQGPGSFRVGPVVAHGVVRWSKTGPFRGIRPLARPKKLRNPTLRPSPTWRVMPDGKRMVGLFLKSVVRRKRRLWVRRSGQKRCEPLSFTQRVRRKHDEYHTETREVSKKSRCWRTIYGYAVSIHAESGLLDFFGPNTKSVLMRRLCPGATGSGSGSEAAAGSVWRVQLVGVQADRVLVVPANRGAVHRYATEDLAIWFFKRSACEAQ